MSCIDPWTFCAKFVLRYLGVTIILRKKSTFDAHCASCRLLFNHTRMRIHTKQHLFKGLCNTHLYSAFTPPNIRVNCMLVPLSTNIMEACWGHLNTRYRHLSSRGYMQLATFTDQVTISRFSRWQEARISA